jgi:glucose/arabinose dehydrogenase
LKRVIAPLSLLFLVALAGCSSTPSTGSSSASPAATAVASSPAETAPPPASETTSPTEAPTSAPVAGGTATDFCGAFAEIQAVSEAPSGDPATVGAQFQAAAADMRKYAPAEIQQAANTYADLMDSIGKAAASGTFDEAALQKAMSDAIAENGKDIGTTAVWVAKNCNL